ncbi:MAG TPA: glutathione S-transferase family protein [Myxococcota bacterium]|nr:glutathione S-transferase family protein [Myxococcota bacterium]
MSIVLYGPAIAPYTEKVVRALGLKKLPFELVEPRSPEDYKRWSPETGLLPVIDIDGERVADSTQILYALDERWPEPPLLSRDPSVAARQRRLEDWVDESFFWYWNQWRRMREEQADYAARRAEWRFSWFQPRSWFESLREPSGAPAPDPGRERFLIAELDKRMEDLVGWLSIRPYFYADEPSMADLSVYAMLLRVRGGTFDGAGDLLADRPSLVAFMDRVEGATGGASADAARHRPGEGSPTTPSP